MSIESEDLSSIYRELSSHFNYPKSDILPKILEKLATYEEAKILLVLPSTQERIAERTKMPVTRVSEIFKDLFMRGIIVPQSIESGKQGYALCGNLLDSTLFWIGAKKARGESLSSDELEVIDLWEKLHEDFLRQKPPTENPPPPIARVIPVNKAIPLETEVLPFEIVSSIIKNAKVIAVAQCPCRTRGKRCNNPLETCLLLDDVADIVIKRGVVRKITVEEALEITEKCEDLGLVHHTDNASESLHFICNCCPCCCGFLRGLIYYGRKNSTTRSRYRSVVNEDLCTGCGICEDRCVFGVMKVENGVAKSDPERCFGCGLCSSKCPPQAISLIPVREKEHIPAKKAPSLLPALPAR